MINGIFYSKEDLNDIANNVLKKLEENKVKEIQREKEWQAEYIRLHPPKEQKYIISYSGGKDSTATVILCHKNDIQVDEIIFSKIMFDETISAELKEHIDFIEKTAFPLFEKWGYKTTIVSSNKTYMDCFNAVYKKSKNLEKNGKKYGFPFPDGCKINSDLKVRPITKYLNKEYDDCDVFQYIGIATDEPSRLKRLHQSKNKISILEEFEYDEKQAEALCVKYDLLNPMYIKYRNLSRGCWFCPNSGNKGLRELRKEKNELWQKLLELERVKGIVSPIFDSRGTRSVLELEEMFIKEEKEKI